jgi:hypothetical protein
VLWFARATCQGKSFRKRGEEGQKIETTLDNQVKEKRGHFFWKILEKTVAMLSNHDKLILLVVSVSC